MQRWFGFIVTLLAAGLIGWWTAQPPAALPADAAPQLFAAGRAMADIRIIAKAPHVTGSPEDAQVRAHLVARLTALGFNVRETRFPLSAKGRERLTKWSGAADTAFGTNIVATRAGSDANGPVVALMAHHDSVWGSPGAADDSAGVASVLEIARALQTVPLKRGLAIILTDGEELGLEGAQAFLATDPLAKRIGVIVNLETRGGGGRANMFETGRGNAAMVDLFRRTVANPSASSMAVKIYELLPNNTDFSPAKARGIAGFNFAFIGRAGLYHSPLATPDAIEQGSVQHLGAQALDITRALVSADALPPRGDDAVFADVLGLTTIAYPPVIGWGLTGLAALLLAAAFVRRGGYPGDIIAGVGRGLGFAVLSGALLFAGNWLSGAGGPTNYYDRLAALPRLEIQAFLLVLAALAIMAGTSGSEAARRGNWLGLGLLGLIMATAVQVLMPAAGPVVLWPLLLALAVLALAPPRGAPSRWLAALAAVPALAQTGGFAHFILLGVGGPIPAAVAAFAPLVLLLLWPLLPVWRWRPAVNVALVLAVAAGAMALWVRLDPLAPSVAVYSDTK